MSNDPVIHILQVGHGCVSSLKKNLSSLSRQSFKKWTLTFVNDGGGDELGAEVDRLTMLYGLMDKVTIINHKQREGFAFHFWNFLESLAKEIQYILVMDGLARFSNDRAFEQLMKPFSRGWMTSWARWRNTNDQHAEVSLHPFEAVRQQPWCFSGPFAFDRRCLETIKVSHFQDAQEKFLLEAGQQALGYHVSESTIKRRCHNEVLFTVDEELPTPFDEEGLWRDDWLSSTYRKELNYLATQDNRAPRVDQQFFQEHLYQYMEMAFLAERTMRDQQIKNKIAFAPANGAQIKRLSPSEFKTPAAQRMVEAITNEQTKPLSDAEQRQRMIEMDIEDTEALAEMGEVEVALEQFQELLKHVPESGRVHTNLGVLYWEQEETQKAMSHFLQAIRYDRDNRDPVMNCAGALVGLGQIDEAKRLCRNFLEMHPNDHPVQELMGELDDLLVGSQ